MTTHESQYESYKITINFRMLQRRETLKGAMALADRLVKQGKHGMVEGVAWPTREGECARFDLIRKF